MESKPGPAKSRGEMKFSLAAGGQIYLHDTPRKELFEEEDRSLSAGCVRLEDAERFARGMHREAEVGRRRSWNLMDR